MAAQLGHQAGAGAVVEPPADQLVEALVAVLGVVDVQVRARGSGRFQLSLVDDVALVVADVLG